MRTIIIIVLALWSRGCTLTGMSAPDGSLIIQRALPATPALKWEEPRRLAPAAGCHDTCKS